MTFCDLDAARRARTEARGGEQVEVRFGGQQFMLPAELPLAIGEKLSANDFFGLARQLIGEDNWPRFTSLNPSIDDVMVLVEHYGDQLGESCASIGISSNTGTPSRPTAPASTESTSPPPYTDLHPSPSGDLPS